MRPDDDDPPSPLIVLRCGRCGRIVGRVLRTAGELIIVCRCGWRNVFRVGTE